METREADRLRPHDKIETFRFQAANGSLPAIAPGKRLPEIASSVVSPCSPPVIRRVSRTQRTHADISQARESVNCYTIHIYIACRRSDTGMKTEEARRSRAR